MNEAKWVEIETTEMRKNVKKKDKEENWRIGEEEIGNGRKREEKWRVASREKEGNVVRNSEDISGVIWIWRRKRNEKGIRKSIEKEEKKKRGGNSGKGRATYDKFKWSQVYEWGKLNWNNQNEEEFKETDAKEIWKSRRKIGKKKDRCIGNAGDNRRGMKSRNKRIGGKERGRWGKKWK